MKYLVFGQDYYRAWRFIRSLSPEKPRIIDPEDDLSACLLELDQSSLFGQARVFVFRNSVSQLRSHFDQIVRSMQEVVIWEEKAKLGISPSELKKLRATFRTKEFRPLSTSETLRWLRHEADSLGLSLTDPVLQRLVELGGNNLAFLKNELSKIDLYLSSERTRSITLEELNKITQGIDDANMYRWLDAVGDKDLTELRQELSSIISTRQVDEWYLFNLLVRHFRQLLKYKLGLGVKGPGFVQRKISKQANNWSIADIELMQEKLLNIEKQTKQGVTDLSPELISLLFGQLMR